MNRHKRKMEPEHEKELKKHKQDLSPELSLPNCLLRYLLSFCSWRTLSFSCLVCKAWFQAIRNINEHTSSWASALSRKNILSEAIKDVILQIERHPLSPRPTFGFLFISSNYPEQSSAVEILGKYLPKNIELIGCTAFGIVATDRSSCPIEIEDDPETFSVSLTLAHIAKTTIHTFSISNLKDIPNFSDPKSMIVLSTIRQPSFIDTLNLKFPSCALVGGIVSSYDPTIFRISEGKKYAHRASKKIIVGLAMEGDLTVSAVTSKGLKQISQKFEISKCEDTMIYSTKDENSVEYYPIPSTIAERLFNGHTAVYACLSEPNSDSYKICVLSIEDTDLGAALELDFPIQSGQKLKLVYTEPNEAKIDVTKKMSLAQDMIAGSVPLGGLMFGCLARGVSFYKKPNVDSTAFAQCFRGIPLSGCFCGGEIGPEARLNNQQGDNRTCSFQQFTTVFVVIGKKILR